MQVQAIQDAIKTKAPKLQLGHVSVDVNPNAAVFITLNPAGRGYGGRQRLPDNLKQLFRPVVMSAPDNQLIAAALLRSEGFQQADPLARKLVAMFRLSKEMLSSQQHYDWGLRALKTVLRGCAKLRTADRDEKDVVVQALLLNTMSKLTSSDSRRFAVLVDDIFGKGDRHTATVGNTMIFFTRYFQFGELLESLAEAAKELKVEVTDSQLQKIFQLHEQLRQRMGCVLLGPAGSGKTTTWRLLQKAIGSNLKVVTFNPKAIPRSKVKQ